MEHYPSHISRIIHFACHSGVQNHGLLVDLFERIILGVKTMTELDFILVLDSIRKSNSVGEANGCKTSDLTASKGFGCERSGGEHTAVDSLHAPSKLHNYRCLADVQHLFITQALNKVLQEPLMQTARIASCIPLRFLDLCLSFHGAG